MNKGLEPGAGWACVRNKGAQEQSEEGEPCEGRRN